MFKSYFPFILSEGIYNRSVNSLSPKCIIPGKTKYDPSRIAALRDAHNSESFTCARFGCNISANRTVTVECDWIDHVNEDFDEYEQFLPQDVPVESLAIIPYCQKCEIEQRGANHIKVQETECILHHNDFERDVYRYFIHCDTKLIIDEDNPEGSICNVCGLSVSQLDYEDEKNGHDDDRPGFSNWGDY